MKLSGKVNCVSPVWTLGIGLANVKPNEFVPKKRQQTAVSCKAMRRNTTIEAEPTATVGQQN